MPLFAGFLSFKFVVAILTVLGLINWAAKSEERGSSAKPSRPRRSPRTPSHVGNSTLDFARGFSFEDGNIVLRAQIRKSAVSQADSETQTGPTGTYVRFRVHKSVLESKSEVFGDIIRIGQASNNAMSVDGVEDVVPVVDVDDDPNDLMRLLQFIYHNHIYLGLSDIKRRFEYLASVLILADKYEMDEIADACRQEISFCSRPRTSAAGSNLVR